MGDYDIEDSADPPDDSKSTPTERWIPATPSRRHLLGLLGTGGLTGIAGCSAVPGQGGQPATDAPADRTTDTETTEFHDHATMGVDYRVASQLDYSILSFYTRTFEPLIWTTPELDVKPWLAVTWDRTGEFTWEFTLRDGVRYHNNDRLTADRVMTMLEYGLSGETGIPMATPQVANTTVPGISKVDEMTIEMETIEPTVNQPANLAILTYFGAHPESSVHTREDFSNPIGTGPFQIDSVKENQHVKLSAFDDYWGGPPQLDELTVRQFDDQNTLALALKGKEIDLGLELPANQHDPVKNAPDTDVATRTAPKTAKVWFDLQSEPFADKSLRKAINYAISQTDVIKATQNGLGTPARGPIPPMIWGSAHDSLPAYGPDTAKARELVEQSAYDGETVALIATNTEPRAAKLVTQVLQQDLDDIGVNVAVQVVGITAWAQRRDSGEGDLFLGEESMNAPDEPFQEAIGRYGSRGKDAPWLDPEPSVQQRLDTLFETVRTNAGKERNDAMQAAQHVIMEEALEAPLYHETYVVGMRNGITDVDWHPLSSWSLFENLTYVK